MTPDEFHAVQELFLRVADLPPQDRDRELAAACQDAPQRKAAVLRMLEAEPRVESSIDELLDQLRISTFPTGTLPRDRFDAVLEPPSGYRLGEELGRGGMGVVYQATQISTNRAVAVKILQTGRADRRRFQIEVEALRRLQHAGIAQIVDAGTIGQPPHDLPYLAMERVEGPAITDYVWDRQLGVDQIVDLFLEVCRAVEHAHQKGVIHRDIKPRNILVTPDGSPKMLDFGVAKLAKDQELAGREAAERDAANGPTVHTAQGQLIGTLQYMSPEQWDTSTDDVDTRTDVYALGLVLYQLLTRHLPYDLGNKPWHEIGRVITQQDPLPLRRHRPDIPRDVELIVQKALAKDKRQRYDSVTELAADLERFRQSEPVRAHPPSLVYRLRKFSRRRPATVVSLVSAFLICAFAAAAVVNHNRQTKLAARERTAVIESIEGDAELSRRQGSWQRFLEQQSQLVSLGRAETPESLLHQINAHFALENWQAAQQTLDRVRSRSDADAYRGACLLWEAELERPRDLPRAKSLVQEAIDAGLTDADAAYARSLRADSYAACLASLKQALVHDPWHYRARLVLGTTLAVVGDEQEAREQISTAQAYFPESPHFRLLDMFLPSEGEPAASPSERAEPLLDQAPVKLAELILEMRRELYSPSFETTEDPYLYIDRQLRHIETKTDAIRAEIERLQAAKIITQFDRLPPVLIESCQSLVQILRLMNPEVEPPNEEQQRIMLEAIEMYEAVAEDFPEATAQYALGILLMTRGIRLPGGTAERDFPPAEQAFLRAVELSGLGQVHKHALFGAINTESFLGHPMQPEPDIASRQRGVQNIFSFLQRGRVTQLEGPVFVTIALSDKRYGLAMLVLDEWRRNEPDNVVVNQQLERVKTAMMADEKFKPLIDRWSSP